MTLDAEALLLPALFAFYVKDCLLLLHANEGVLERRGSRGWHVAFGSHNFTLSGRQPCLLHPLTPHRPSYRMRWSMTGARDASAWSDDPPRALLGLVPWSLAIALALFGLVPFTLLSHAPMPTLLASVALLYALIVAALWDVWRCREPLGLVGRSWAALAGQVLLCPPYAVNLVRRLSLHASPAADLLATARVRLDRSCLAQVQRECVERIRLQLELEDEGTPHSAALERARQDLAALVEADEFR